MADHCKTHPLPALDIRHVYLGGAFPHASRSSWRSARYGRSVLLPWRLRENRPRRERWDGSTSGETPESGKIDYAVTLTDPIMQELANNLFGALPALGAPADAATFSVVQSFENARKSEFETLSQIAITDLVRQIADEGLLRRL